MLRGKNQNAVDIRVVPEQVGAVFVHDPDNGVPRIFPLQSRKEGRGAENVAHGSPLDEQELFLKRLIFRAVPARTFE
jgi:hypothetical protein